MWGCRKIQKAETISVTVYNHHVIKWQKYFITKPSLWRLNKPSDNEGHTMWLKAPEKQSDKIEGLFWQNNLYLNIWFHFIIWMLSAVPTSFNINTKIHNNRTTKPYYKYSDITSDVMKSWCRTEYCLWMLWCVSGLLWLVDYWLM